MIDFVKLSSTAIPIYTSVGDACEHLFFHPLNFADLIGEKWYLVAILVSISLTMNEIEHIFIYIRATCILFFGELVFELLT